MLIFLLILDPEILALAASNAATLVGWLASARKRRQEAKEKEESYLMGRVEQLEAMLKEKDMLVSKSANEISRVYGKFLDVTIECRNLQMYVAELEYEKEEWLIKNAEMEYKIRSYERKDK